MSPTLRWLKRGILCAVATFLTFSFAGCATPWIAFPPKELANTIQSQGEDCPHYPVAEEHRAETLQMLKEAHYMQFSRTEAERLAEKSFPPLEGRGFYLIRAVAVSDEEISVKQYQGRVELTSHSTGRKRPRWVQLPQIVALTYRPTEVYVTASYDE